MPVNLSLSDDERYLIYEIEDPVGMDELLEAYKQEKAYRDAHEYTMHSIVDMSKVKGVPRNWLTAKAGPGLMHPRSGRILFVGISYGIGIIVQTLLKFARYDRMLFFDTREEAEEEMATLVEETKSYEDPTISTR